MPKVTVLMAVYNGERYLREAIESILAQTFQDFEFLIINDGSTDNSREVILSYEDPRIRLVDNEVHLGLTPSLNKGLRLAKGELVARQDADDISEPERLAMQVTFLETHPEVGLLGTWYRKIDAQGTLIGNRSLPCDYTEIRWSLLFFCPFVHSSVMVRKSVILRQVGFYNEALVYAADYELWYRIAHHIPVANLNKYLVRLRINPYSMTFTYGERTREGDHIRRDTVAHLLDWDKNNVASNEMRLSNMTALLFGSSLALHLQEIPRLVEEILRLYTAFCQFHKISPRDNRIHCIKLHFQLSKQLIRLAQSYFERGDIGGARQLQKAACRLHWPILLTKSHVRLFCNFLIGLRFWKAMKRFVPKILY